MSRPNSLIVTGGGTGGHIFAGVSIADAWKEKYPNARILFVGARGGIEERLVPRAGYELALVELGSLKGVSIGKRLKTLFQIPLSLLKALGILIREKPSAVIGVGGYASGPIVLMARFTSYLHGTRVAILEQNAVPGFTNRILGKFAHIVFCAFPGIEKQFTGTTQVTGNPVRKEMTPMPSSSREPFTIFITGGSQGALGINTLIIDALPHLQDLKPRLRFIHQTGEKDLERVKAGYEKSGFTGKIEKFIYEMPDCFRQASLVVCRAGSSTLSELAAVKRASVLVPFPYAADNHQEMNARLFTEQGAALLMLQQKSKGEELASVIRGFLTHPDRITQMETRVAAFYRPHAAKDVVVALAEPR